MTRSVLELWDAASEVRQYARWAIDPANRSRFEQVANEVEVAANEMDRLRRRRREHPAASPLRGKSAGIAGQNSWIWRIAVSACAALAALGLYILTAQAN